MKRTTPTSDFTIKQVDTDCFKVFDRNQHFRRSFGTRKGAEDFIAQQRTGKTPARTDMTQAAPRAA